MKHIKLSLLCSVMITVHLTNIEGLGHSKGAPVHVHNVNTNKNVSPVLSTQEKADNDALQSQIDSANSELADMQSKFQKQYGVEMKLDADLKNKLKLKAKIIAAQKKLKNVTLFVNATMAVGLVGVAVLIGKIVYDSVKKKTGLSDQDLQKQLNENEKNFNTPAAEQEDKNKKGILDKIRDGAAQGLNVGMNVARGMVDKMASFGSEVVQKMLGKKKVADNQTLKLDESVGEDIKKFFEGELTQEHITKMEQAGIKGGNGTDLKNTFDSIKKNINILNATNDAAGNHAKARQELQVHNVLKENGEWNKELVMK